MPKIPTYQGGQGLPGAIGKGRISRGVAAQVGVAVAGLGRDISRAGTVLAQRAAEIQAEDDRIYINEQVSNYETEILPLTNAELGTRGGAAVGGGERISKQLQDLSEKRLQNVPPHLQEELRNRFAVKNNHRYGQVLFHESGQRVVWQRDTDNLVVQTQRKNAFNNPLGFATYLGSAKNALGDRYTEQNRSDILAAAVDNLILNDPVTAKEFFVNVRDGMTVDHQKSYEKEIDQAIKTAEKQKKLDADKVKKDQEEREKAQAEEDKAAAGDLLRQRSLGFDFVGKMRVDADEKEKWFNRAIHQNDEIVKKGAAGAEAAMRERISISPKSIKDESEIWDLIDDGVTPATTQTLVDNWNKKIKAPKPESDARAKDLQGSVNRLRTAGLFLPTEETEPSAANAKLVEEQTWRELSTNIDNFFADNPDASDSDVARFSERLFQPYKEKATESWFAGLEERIKKIAPLVSGPAATAQALLGEQADEGTGVNERRQQAIDILNDANEQVTEERIQWVMENKL